MCTFWTLCGHFCEPNLSWKVLENEFCESWKTLEFGLCKSWKVLENSFLLSVRTLVDVGVWMCEWRLQQLRVTEVGRSLMLQTDLPHLVSLGAGRLSTTVTLLPLPPGIHRRLIYLPTTGKHNKQSLMVDFAPGAQLTMSTSWTLSMSKICSWICGI